MLNNVKYTSFSYLFNKQPHISAKPVNNPQRECLFSFRCKNSLYWPPWLSVNFSTLKLVLVSKIPYRLASSFYTQICYPSSMVNRSPVGQNYFPCWGRSLNHQIIWLLFHCCMKKINTIIALLDSNSFYSK